MTAINAEEEALNSVKAHSFQKCSLEKKGRLMEALNHASSMLNELTTSLSPKSYHVNFPKNFSIESQSEFLKIKLAQVILSLEDESKFLQMCPKLDDKITETKEAEERIRSSLIRMMELKNNEPDFLKIAKDGVDSYRKMSQECRQKCTMIEEKLMELNIDPNLNDAVIDEKKRLIANRIMERDELKKIIDENYDFEPNDSALRSKIEEVRAKLMDLVQ